MGRGGSGGWIDIICLSETWLNKFVGDGLIGVDGYVTHRRDRRRNQRGGGLCIFKGYSYLELCGY